MENFDALLYDPLYEAWGVDGSIKLTPESTPVPVRVIDLTSGVEVNMERGGIVSQLLRPACAVRMAQLNSASISVDDIDGGEVTFNNRNWTIDSHLMNPSPSGEDKGEIYLILQEPRVLETPTEETSEEPSDG